MKSRKKGPKKRLPQGLISWLIVAACILVFGTLYFPPSSQSVRPTSVRVEAKKPEVQPIPSTGGEESQPSPPLILTEPSPAASSHVSLSGKPKIAIVIDDVGLDIKGSKRAIELPAYVTLSFLPYASHLRDQSRDAREHGHELLLHMPMEPVGRDDPGPGALLVGLSPQDLQQRFQLALSSFVGFDGVNNHMGSKFTADQQGMDMVISELQERHLFFLDSRTSSKTVGEATARRHGLPAISRDVFLDDEESIASVKKQLIETEKIARHKGYAVAIGHPHATTMQALSEWLPEAEVEGYVLVPLHNLVAP